MNAEEQSLLDQLKLMQRVRNALLGLGEFGTDKASEDLLFFDTGNMMLTCELIFEEVSELESTSVNLRCKTQLGKYKLVGEFNYNSSDADLQRYSRSLFKMASCVLEDRGALHKQREIRLALGMEN